MPIKHDNIVMNTLIIEQFSEYYKSKYRRKFYNMIYLE